MSNQFQLPATYLSMRDRIKPGDVIAFSGVDLPSTVVKVATQSRYVHVAIVFSNHQPGETQGETNQQPGAEKYRDSLLIAESHIDLSLPSVGTGKQALGVQLQWLTNRLVSAQGPVWWTPLKQPLTLGQIRSLQRWLWNIEEKGTPYDFVQAVGAGMDAGDCLGLENTPDESAFFCSELVTCALQKVGVISDRINASEQTPADLMAFSCFQDPILIQGQA